jgi:hypothetical protein
MTQYHLFLYLSLNSGPYAYRQVLKPMSLFGYSYFWISYQVFSRRQPLDLDPSISASWAAQVTDILHPVPLNIIF